jgi:hypothetical protein
LVQSPAARVAIENLFGLVIFGMFRPLKTSENEDEDDDEDELNATDVRLPSGPLFCLIWRA